jgi:hypothetical protein
MEELMTIDSANLVSGSDIVDDKAVDDPAGEYTRTWTVNTGAGSVYHLSVQVEWNEGGTDAHSITIDTQRSL